MRVLHINSGRMFGGVETFLVTLARQAGLCRNMESAFAVCFPGRFSEELAAAGASVHSLGTVQTRFYWSVLRARLQLRALLNREAFDAVICHMPWNHAIFGPEVRRAGIPLLFWQHGLAEGRGWLERWARRTPPQLAISNSRFTAGTLALLFPEAPQEILYYPVSPAHAAAEAKADIRRRLGVPPGQVVIIQVSRMEAWKGHSLHLRALAELKDDSSWTCWIAGGAQRKSEQTYVAELKNQARQLGISDRVVFLGQCSNVPELLQAADIFCQPNESGEPFGIVFIEALANGLPVVTTRLGGGAEIVTEQEGYLAAPGDPASLAEGLRRLIQYPEARRALGGNGPLRARNLCDPRTQMERLYQCILPLTERLLPRAVAQ